MVATAQAIAGFPSRAFVNVGVAKSGPTRVVTSHKDDSIETLRGAAIILMVAGHVIGETHLVGLRVSDDSWLRYFYYSFKYLRMPLFTVISGYLYAGRPARRDTARQLIDSKARRLLLPLLTVSTTQYLVQAMIPSSNQHVTLAGLPRILLWPYAQFWFLPALFEMFLLAAWADTRGWLDRFDGWARWWLIIVGVYMATARLQTDFLALSGFMWVLPFFFLGYGLRRFPADLQQGPALAGAGAMFLVSFGIQQAVYCLHAPLGPEAQRLLALAVGTSGITALMAIRRPFEPLAWIGHYAYGIYLFHVFGTAGMRLVLRAAHVHDTAVLFSCCLFGGLAFPLVLQPLLERSAVTRKWVLGLKA